MTRRAGLPRFSALSVRRGDAGHREACATPSESLGKTPPRRHGPAGGALAIPDASRLPASFNRKGNSGTAPEHGFGVTAARRPGRE